MRRIILSFSVVMGCLTAPALSMADDNAIAEQIISQLDGQKQAGNLHGFNLNMKVLEGTVMLEGDVLNQQQQSTVIDIARRVPGVVRVVTAIEVRPTDRNVSSRNPAPSQAEQGSSEGIWGGVTSAVSQVMSGQSRANVQPAAVRPDGSPTDNRMAYRESPALTAPLQVAQTSPVQVARPAPSQANHPGLVPTTSARPLQVAQAPAASTWGAGQVGMPVPIGSGAVPAYVPGTGQGVQPAAYDHPSMPGYAWPSYASHPNYAAVTYPQQYSPATWPYIGPFYPYPQVPLGWRKVTLEWDDGWWFLDFKDR